MKLVAYCRVSTDDKGQDPRRQEDVLRRWADQNGHELVAVVLDEGTSGSVTPFQRQFVLEAVQRAEEAKADGLVVESVDRWTRGGIEDFFASTFTLRLKHGLVVLTAQTPQGMSTEMVALFHAMMAAGAREYRENMNRQIRAGIERAKRLGWPKGEPGRKPKPALTVAEKDLVRRMAAEGAGVDLIAHEVSKGRGQFEVADPKAQANRKVGPTWMWERIRSEMPDVAERLSARRAAYAPAKEHVSEPGMAAKAATMKVESEQTATIDQRTGEAHGAGLCKCHAGAT